MTTIACLCYVHIDTDPAKTRIVHCPLHAAAQDLLDGLEVAVECLNEGHLKTWCRTAIARVALPMEEGPVMLPHLVIEVRGGVVTFVDGFSSREAAAGTHQLSPNDFETEPKTGVCYAVVDHDDLEEGPDMPEGGRGA